MLHISDEDLVAALTPGTVPGTDGRPASEVLAGWRRQRADPAAPRPVDDLRGWADRRAQRPDAPAVDGLLAAAEALHTEQVDLLDSSRGRSRFYGFHYLRWMLPLLEAYALTGEARHAVRWGELLSQWYAAREQVVGDWPGLDVIWYSLGVWSRGGMFNRAIALLSAEPAFSDEHWVRTMKCLLGGARWAAEEHTWFRNGNWQLASVSELAHVANLFGEFTEAPDWRRIARDRIEDHLELDFYADGGHHERAPSYHAMCLQVLRVAALSADAEDWPLRHHPRFRAGYDWLATMAHPPGWVPHLQDSHIVRPAAELLAGHQLFGEPSWKWLVERWLDPVQIADTLDRAGPVGGEQDPVEAFHAAPSRPPSGRSVLLPQSGYAVLRRGWEDPGLTAVVNLGPYVGHELEPHSHHACLDFVLSGGGQPLAWEAGGPNSYDDPGYYDWFQAARGHNTVVLPGEPDSAGRNPVTDTFAALRGPGESGLDVVAGRHDAWPQRHRRQLVFVASEPAYWWVRDDVGGAAVDWTIHARTPWRADGAGWSSEQTPGLHVLTADAPTRVRHDGGPARIPLAQVPLPGDTDRALTERRHTPDDYGTLHTLVLERSADQLHTLLLPHLADAAVAPDPSTDPAARIAIEDDTCVVYLGRTVDHWRPEGWSRTREGTESERARWGLDPEDAGEGWISGAGLVAWWCRIDGDRVDAVVHTDRQAVVSLPVRTQQRISVNGVAVATPANPAVQRTVSLPAAGEWRIEVRP